MPASLPPYPPKQDAWRFPPPPVSRRWLWVAIAGSTAAMLTVVAMVTVMIVVGTRDLPTSLDDPEIVEAVARGCEEIESVADLVEVDSLDIDRPDRIEVQNEAIQDVIDTWTSMDPDVRAADEPFDEWIADWQRLIDARVDYHDELQRRPHALFDEPRVDGDLISDRMNAVANGCLVPASLLEPDQGIEQPA